MMLGAVRRILGASRRALRVRLFGNNQSAAIRRALIPEDPARYKKAEFDFLDLGCRKPALD